MSYIVDKNDYWQRVTECSFNARNYLKDLRARLALFIDELDEIEASERRKKHVHVYLEMADELATKLETELHELVRSRKRPLTGDVVDDVSIPDERGNSAAGHKGVRPARAGDVVDDEQHQGGNS